MRNNTIPPRAFTPSLTRHHTVAHSATLRPRLLSSAAPLTASLLSSSLSHLPPPSPTAISHAHPIPRRYMARGAVVRAAQMTGPLVQLTAFAATGAATWYDPIPPHDALLTPPIPPSVRVHRRAVCVAD